MTSNETIAKLAALDIEIAKLQRAIRTSEAEEDWNWAAHLRAELEAAEWERSEIMDNVNAEAHEALTQVEVVMANGQRITALRPKSLRFRDIHDIAHARW
jgi:hypothetical protein